MVFLVFSYFLKTKFLLKIVVKIHLTEKKKHSELGARHVLIR